MRYVQTESPENMFNCQRILDISFKKTSKPTIKYLSAEDMKLIFEQPDLSTTKGVVVISLATATILDALNNDII